MIARLNAAVTAALKDPDIHGKLMKSGATPAATSPAEFGALLKEELARWGKVVREKGIKPEFVSEMRALRCLFILMIAGLGGCVDSSKPLFGPETRAVPFRSGTQFEVDTRNHSGQPWRKQDKIRVLDADADKVIRPIDSTGKPSDEEQYTLHRIGPDHFILQFERGGIFSYGVVEYRNNEAIVTMFDCKEIDQRVFELIGGRMSR